MSIANQSIRLLLFLIFCGMLFSCSRQPYTVLNKGIAGNSTSDLISRLHEDVLSHEPDIVIMMAGTNDMLNSSKFATYQAFTANYLRIIEKVKAAGRTMVLMTIPPVDTAYLFKRHDKTAFTELPNEKIETANQIISRLAAEHELVFVDINHAFRIRNSPNPGESSLIMNMRNAQREDGVHPTREGYELIAQEIFTRIKKEGLLKNSCTIVCFGDSITFGTFMEGAGTSDGETYPAYLKRMIARDP